MPTTALPTDGDQTRAEPRDLGVTARRAVLGGTFAAALVMRWIHSNVAPPTLFATTDNLWYHEYARSVADGRWGRIRALGGGEVISLKFPPLFPWVLGIGERIVFWADPFPAQQLVAGVLGATAAPLAAWLALRLTSTASPRTRLAVAGAAGVVVAFHPLLIGASNAIMAEASSMPLVLGAVLLLDRVVVRGDRDARVLGPSALALGAVIAAAALTRSDALVVLGGAAVITLWRHGLRRTLVGTVVVAAVPVLTVATATSLAAGRPVLVATNTASAVAGASCDRILHGADAGYWSFDCLVEVPLDHTSAETQEKVLAEWDDPFGLVPQLGPETEADLQSAQVRYVRDAWRERPGALVRVMPVRAARGLGVYWGGIQPAHEFFEGRDADWERAGRWVHVVLVLPSLVALGIAVARARTRLGQALRAIVEPRRLTPIATVLALWLLTTVVTYGSTRLRASVDPLLVVLATLGGAAVVRAFATSRPTSPTG